MGTSEELRQRRGALGQEAQTLLHPEKDRAGARRGTLGLRGRMPGTVPLSNGRRGTGSSSVRAAAPAPGRWRAGGEMAG